MYKNETSFNTTQNKVLFGNDIKNKTKVSSVIDRQNKTPIKPTSGYYSTDREDQLSGRSGVEENLEKTREVSSNSLLSSDDDTKTQLEQNTSEIGGKDFNRSRSKIILEKLLKEKIFQGTNIIFQQVQGKLSGK